MRTGFIGGLGLYENLVYMRTWFGITLVVYMLESLIIGGPTMTLITLIILTNPQGPTLTLITLTNPQRPNISPSNP
jgi:hypothetical protein